MSLVLFSTAVCTAIGVPVGIATAHRPCLFRLLHPLLDWMQTIPTFVYLIPTLVLFGLGVVPGLISTVIFAIPAPIRLTHLGISSVPNVPRADGLGRPVVRAPNSVNIAMGFEAGLAIVILAIILDRVFKRRGKRTDDTP